MTLFRTPVEPERSSFTISPESKSLLVGSCFSENIGERLRDYKFDTVVNPYGILFNPHSILHALVAMLSDKEYTVEDLVRFDGKWHSFAHHGSFSAITEADALQKINEYHKLGAAQLKTADFMIITFGSAWVYEHFEGNIVANCHKFPNNQFTKKKLGVNEIIHDWSHLITHLREVNPEIRLIFTVSPVRHLKDGVVENTWSKSTLNLAIHELVRRFDDVNYFPSFEIVMDDLRDYRFFKDDMLHPNKQAIDYIWDKFGKSYFSEDVQEYIDHVAQIKAAVEHKPHNPNAPKHQRFVVEQLNAIKELNEKYPFANLGEEKKYFEEYLIR